MVTMSDPLRLVELNELDGPRRVVDEFRLLNLFVDGRVQLRVADLVELHVWEEVIDQRQEQGLVLVDQLGQVHVSQDPHHDRGF